MVRGVAAGAQGQTGSVTLALTERAGLGTGWESWTLSLLQAPFSFYFLRCFCYRGLKRGTDFVGNNER